MVLARTSVHVVEQAPQNGCYQNLCPQGDSSCLHVSLGDSPRSAGRSASGYCQTTASALILEQVRLLCAPFKSGDSISHSSLGLPKGLPKGPQAFKDKHSGVSSSRPRTAGLGSPRWGSDPSLLGENLCNCKSPPVCGLPTWVYGS